ncbi:hypothetical protein KUCAC02_011327 [Chaenocephalus aceratus]|uniref:Uncharacterized protein n=1 Tax=Chaenocephalus aceratus TaxID=36190 RepID=A0ACB9WX11_CHAAC|nr:hypothetical protein KUCAC02_011327 [Chaenocephalus aceratus]
MFQHPSSDNKGEVRAPPKVVDSRAKKVPELPESFTNIPPAFFNKKNPAPPSVAEVSMPDPSLPHMAASIGSSEQAYDETQAVYMYVSVTEWCNLRSDFFLECKLIERTNPFFKATKVQYIAYPCGPMPFVLYFL